MTDHLVFTSREEFRNWLQDHCLLRRGVWLLFGKPGGPETLKASEALEEALCFGWIDGRMQRVDDETYLKYFSIRRTNSKWSAKNKELVAVLEKRGIMTDYGRRKILEARENGQWNVERSPIVEEKQVAILSELLKEYEVAWRNFQGMSASVRKTYTRAYLDAKTEAGRKKRLAWTVERLNENRKPMG